MSCFRGQIDVQSGRSMCQGSKSVPFWINIFIFFISCRCLRLGPLMMQGNVPELMGEIKSVFPMDVIFTPGELLLQYNGSWPSVDTLSSLGKKIILVTGFDYGPIIDTMMFSKWVRIAYVFLFLSILYMISYWSCSPKMKWLSAMKQYTKLWQSQLQR